MQSRNLREGRYVGKRLGLYFRTHDKRKFRYLPNRGFSYDAWAEREPEAKQISDIRFQKKISFRRQFLIGVS
jgi:hypothetical protein